VREVLWLSAGAVVLLLAGIIRFAIHGERHLGTSTQRATYQALHTANLAAPALRTGLHGAGAGRSIAHLHSLLGSRGVILADLEGVLASEGIDAVHGDLLRGALSRALTSGHPQVLGPKDLVCPMGAVCELQAGVIVPLQVDGTVVGALATLDNSAPAGILRLCSEVAQFISTQLELSELDRSRQRLVQAELRFLRAQISPHFIYNALTAIESFVRTDPDRARSLLVEFAEFTRYSFRSHSQYVTMADELRLVDTYLDLERARFGDRLAVTLRVAPEVLSVKLPSLILQPIVENAVRHGLEPSGRPGHLEITVSDGDHDALVSVADNGAGAEPSRIRRVLSGGTGGDEVGLHNVDERLRTEFGDDYGLVIETGIGAGTTVSIRIPKFRAWVVVS
jgi:two-component system LytT family sensor kinase